VKAVNGDWLPLNKARFTADVNPVLDIDAGAAAERYFLATGLRAPHGRHHGRRCDDPDLLGFGRLDLGRVGVMPVPSRLCTTAAKAREMILWADGRASFHVVPDFVMDEWGLDIKSP
jgi:hypothetical protein